MKTSASATASQTSGLVDASGVGRVLDRYLAALEQGQAPAIEQVLADHPEMRDLLEPALRKLHELHRVALGVQDDSAAPHARDVGLLSGVLGDFRIVREIGRGGMGVVYEAEQISLRRPVALKVLPFAAMLDSRRLARFRNEAQAAAQLHHSNIVPIYFVGCDRGVHYYAMQFIEGQTLAEVIVAIRVQGSGFGVQQESHSHALRDSHSHALRGNAFFAALRRETGAAPSADSMPIADSSDRTAERPTPGRRNSRAERGNEKLIPEPRTLNSSSDTQPIGALSTLHSAKPRDYFRMIAELGIQAAEALQYAHDNGILHRDIKPSNVMIECSHLPGAPGRDEASPKASPSRASMSHHAEGGDDKLLNPEPRTLNPAKLWITDFGLARIESDPTLTGTGDVLGTLRYMSPEQAAGERLLDERTDVYSLGVTLYEALTLQPAFTEEDSRRLLDHVLHTEPPPPRKHNRSIPLDLETIVCKAMAKERADRYASAQALAEDLRRFLSQKPIVARRPSLLDRSLKWARRHRLPVALSLLTMVILAALAIGGWHTASVLSDQVEEITKLKEAAQAGQRSAEARLAKERREQYITDIQAAVNALADGKYRHADRLLDRQLPSADRSDQRDFVWSMLKRQTDCETARLIGHDGPVSAVAFSQDGNRVATGGHDGTVRMWYAGSGVHGPIFRAHAGNVNAVSFLRGKSALVSCGDDGRIAYWSYWKSEPAATWTAHEGNALCLAVRNDGELLASAGEDGVVRLWQLPHGEPAGELRGHTDWVRSLVFSHDGATLFSASHDGTVKQWDLSTLSTRTTMHGHKKTVLTIDLSPDGESLASGGDDNTVRLWNVGTGQQIAALDGHENRIRSVRFLPDGKSLVSADNVGVVFIWDLASGKRVWQVPVTHEANIWAMDLSADGQRIATASVDGTAKVWQVRPNTPPQAWQTEKRLRFALAKRRLVVAASGLSVGTVSPFQLLRTPSKSAARFESVAISSNGKIVLATKSDARPTELIAAYRAADLKLLAEFDASPENFDCIAISPDGNRFLASTREGSLHVFEISTKKRHATLSLPSEETWTEVFWLPNGKVLAARNSRNRTTFWSAEDFQLVFQRDDLRQPLSFSPDGQWVALGDGEPNVRLLRWTDLTEKPSLVGHRQEILRTAFSPDGKLLASADAAGQVKIWDVALRHEMLTLNAGGSPIRLEFAPDGKSLVAAVRCSPDGRYKLLIWSGKPSQ